MNDNNGSKTVLVAILMVLVFGVGFLIGRVTANQNIGSFSGSNVKDSDKSGSDTGQNGNNSSNMTEEQRKMMSALGIDPNQFNITAEMIACAETKLGASRVNEIKNGATPTFSEGASLMVCYK